MAKYFPPILLLTLLIVFFGKHVFPVGGNFIGGIDVKAYHFWEIHFIKEQLLSWSLPLWNPYVYCGHPFFLMNLSPLAFLYVILPFDWASNLDLIFNLFIAGMGMYFLVRLIAGSKYAGLIAAMVYSMSGYFMASIFAGHLTKIHSSALIPWVFFFVEKGFRTRQISYFIISGVIFGLQIMTGNIQNNVYTAYFISFYYIIRYFTTFRKFDLKNAFTYAKYFLVFPITAFGIAAPNLLFSGEYLSLSDRAESTYDFATFLSFFPKNFYTFLVANPETSLINLDYELGCYMGILPILLAGIGILVSTSRRVTLALVILLLVSTTFMLGSYTPAYKLYYHLLPFMANMRVPARSVILFIFFVSILAGFGAKYLIEKPDKSKLFPFLIVSIPILFTALFGGAYAFNIPFTSKTLVFAVVFSVSAYAILFATPFLKNSILIAGLIIAALFVDLYLTLSPGIPTLNLGELLEKRGYESQLEQDRGFYRIMTPMIFADSISDMASRGSVFHYFNAGGYIPAPIRDFYQFMHAMADVPVPLYTRHTLDLQLFTPERVLSSKIMGIKYACILTNSGLKFMKASWYMPRALLVRNALIVPDYKDHVQYLKNPGFNPTKVIVLEKDSGDHIRTLSKEQENTEIKDQVEIIKYTPNRIELKSSSPVNTYLLMSEFFYPGWKAYVDGKKVPILRADYLLRAVPLVRGDHSIIFVYRPMSYMFGLILTFLTLIILGYYFFKFRQGCAQEVPLSNKKKVLDSSGRSR